jgi:hypothetical protein
MGAWKPILMTDRLEGHLDELGPLLRLRHACADGSRVTAKRLGEFDERIAAHLDAILVFDSELPQLLKPYLADSDPDTVLAVMVGLAAHAQAAAALLQQPWDALVPPADALLAAASLARCGCQAWADGLVAPARGAGRQAALATAILAARRQPSLPTAPTGLLADPDAQARLLAWWSLGYQSTPVTPAALAGMADPDPLVQVTCIETLAWQGVADVSARLLSLLAKAPPVSPLWSLAARLAADPALQAAVRIRAQDATAGPVRCTWLAALGMSQDVAALLPLLRDGDVRVAVAAGDAFTDLTGIDIDSQRRATIPPDDAKPGDDADLFPDRWLPDPDAAAAAWEKRQGSVPHDARLNQGCVYHDREPDPQLRLDRRAARSVALRQALTAAQPRPPWA